MKTAGTRRHLFWANNLKLTLRLFLLLLVSCQASAQALTYGIYHSQPRLNPTSYWSEKDQFLLNILYYGCEFKKLQTQGFFPEWWLAVNEQKIHVHHRSPQQQKNLQAAWAMLSVADFSNPRRKLLEPFEQQSNILVLNKQAIWHLWRLNSVALQYPNLEALEPLGNARYLLNNADKKCQIIIYQNLDDMQQDWQAKNLDRVFLEVENYFFDSDNNQQLTQANANKIGYWPSSLLVYASFGGQVLKNNQLQEILRLMLPLPKNLTFLEPAYSFVPLSLIPADQTQVAKLRQAKIAFQQIPAVAEFKIAYPQLDGMLELATELGRFLEASFSLKPKILAVDSQTDLAEADYDLLLSIADLDHGELTNIWNEMFIPTDLPNLESLAKLQRHPNKIPLWWKMHAYLSHK